MRFKSRLILCLLFLLATFVVFGMYYLKKNTFYQTLESNYESHQLYNNLSFNLFYETFADIRTEDLMNKIDKDVKKALNRNNYATIYPLNFKDLKIFVVPHSHCDPGWHKTIDQYYNDQVSYILTNAVNKLTIYKTITFVWAETIFLSMWWKNANQDLKDKFRNLVKSGRLEIVSGGWVIPDEANPHYFALIDQMIEGHSWLFENIGVMPNVSWSLDPFGYSSFISYLHKSNSFKASVILRVHKDIKNELQNRRALEFYWRQPWDHSESTDMFTLLMPYMLYNIKHSCGPNTNICLKFDFRRIQGEMSEAQSEPITEKNVKSLALLLVDQYRRKAALYRHNVVLVPIGDDFRYDRDIEWDQQFVNYQLLFDYINHNMPDVKIQFGTPSDYFKEVSHRTSPKNFPSLLGDFFPYTDRDNEYWTGYFTTRPYGKSLSRELEIFVKAADLLASYVSVKRILPTHEQQSLYKNIGNAHGHLAYFQHHDAITGTSVEPVTLDYINRLLTGLTITKDVIKTCLKVLLSVTADEKNIIRILGSPQSLALSPSDNIIPIKNTVANQLHVFNPSALNRTSNVDILVDSKLGGVFDREGKKVECQITLMAEHTFVNRVNFKISSAPFQLSQFVIKADNVASHCTFSTSKTYTSKDKDFVLENDVLSVTISSFDGQINFIKLKKTGVNYSVKSQLMFYSSKRSGAYIFTPNGPAHPVTLPNQFKIDYISGPLFSEVRMNMGSVQLVYRLVNSDSLNSNAIQIELISNLGKEDNDKEYILRLSSKIKSNNIFYTDQNGYNFVRRIRQQHQPVEANYFPATSAIYIEDSILRMTFVLTQPHGVTSHASGSMEVMFDRRLLYDDGRGMGNGVMDNRPVLTRMALLLEYISLESKFFEEEVIRAQIGDKSKQVKIMLSPPSLSVYQLIENIRNFNILAVSPTSQTSTKSFSIFPQLNLSSDIEIIHLRCLRMNQFLLIIRRVLISSRYSIINVFKDNTSSKQVFKLNQILASFKIKNIEETNFTGNKLIRSVHINETLIINPMEMKTFKLYL